MKTLFSIATMLVMACASTLSADSNTFMDYQNYDHGYCADCNCEPCSCNGSEPQACNTCEKPNPCDPPATCEATDCGINLCCLGVGVVAIAGAAAIIISTGNGTSSH